MRINSLHQQKGIHMLKVHEILQLSLCKNFETLCGEEYLDNTFSGAVILEYESIRTGYTAFNFGDFVLASYFLAEFNPEIINNALSIIIKRHVSGIAIKKSPEQTIPSYIIDLANENHVPVFTFNDQYMEDLIINISENLKTKAQYIVFEEKLNSILNGNLDKHMIKNTALEINPDFLPYVISASITPKDDNDNIAIHSYFKRLMYSQYRNTEKCYYSFVKHDFGIVIICSFDKENLLDNGSHYNYISTLLHNVEFDPNQFYIGICDNAMPLNTLNISVSKAIDANKICHYLGCDYKVYSNTGIYKYIMSIVNNKNIYKDIDYHISQLKEYDAKYDSNILETLIVYIKNNGDIPKTANELFQHTNTIRYRIKKACLILSLSEDNSYEELFLIISCYLLNTTIIQ